LMHGHGGGALGPNFQHLRCASPQIHHGARTDRAAVVNKGEQSWGAMARH
jgi:hypothetical protein